MYKLFYPCYSPILLPEINTLLKKVKKKKLHIVLHCLGNELDIQS